MKKKNKFILVVLALLVISTSLFMVGCSEKEMVTVKFHRNTRYLFPSHQDTIYMTMQVEKGSHIETPPSQPADTVGLLFLGWYKDPECTQRFDFNSETININLDLYAKWEDKW